MKEIRTIHLTLAPCGIEEEGCIERASFTKQDDDIEGSYEEPSPTRVAFRIFDGDSGFGECGWMASCRTPRELRGGARPMRSIGDGSDEAMIDWLNNDPALRENGGDK